MVRVFISIVILKAKAISYLSVMGWNLDSVIGRRSYYWQGLGQGWSFRYVTNRKPRSADHFTKSGRRERKALKFNFYYVPPPPTSHPRSMSTLSFDERPQIPSTDLMTDNGV